MNVVYVVSFCAKGWTRKFNSRKTRHGILRLYTNLDDAFDYVEALTNCYREQLENAWKRCAGQLVWPNKFNNTDFIIEEHVLE